MLVFSSALFTFHEIKVRQLSCGVEKTNAYLIEKDGRTIVIDACSKDVVKELGDIILDYIILTHEHCDHLWGLNILREAYPEAKVIAHERCSEAIGEPKTNKAKQYHIYAVVRFGESYQNDEAKNKSHRCEPTDITFSEMYTFILHGLEIELLHAPGHSPGSVIIDIRDIGVFTGDSVILDDDIHSSSLTAVMRMILGTSHSH